MVSEFWKGRRVFLTGHTGFKGSWLALWMQRRGAVVSGYALAPPTQPNLFEAANIARGMTSTIGNLADRSALSAALAKSDAQIVFHLAAQPLVSAGYADPVETYATNVMGLVHLLEAVRATKSVRTVLNVTTDKCYEDQQQSRPYREDDRLGGRDPYCSSKACAEIVTAAYRQAFLDRCGVATARSGNVIGGGDWAPDRLLPDVFRAIDRKTGVVLRHPDAVRPWQHVFDCLGGYLVLAQRLHEDAARFAGAWNFGPSDDDAKPVRRLVERVLQRWPSSVGWKHEASEMTETNVLTLDSSKSRSSLGWRPRLSLEAGLDRTIDWHRAHANGDDMRAFSEAQIREYEELPAS